MSSVDLSNGAEIRVKRKRQESRCISKIVKSWQMMQTGRSGWKMSELLIGYGFAESFLAG